jgi:formylglycine-generating enzyme required for sulfatase activity
VLGTPDFMPPEQRRDASLVDHRSDLWSLAATAYQMVTGRSPKVINLRNVPSQLHDVLGKALEDEKEARCQSARDLRDALRSAVRDGHAVAHAVKPVSGKLQEGQCSSCGTVNTDLNRKFCRECGGPLRVPCLKCDIQIPVWDTICGECGGNQPAILTEKTASLQAKREAAEASLREHAYDGAISAAKTLAKLPHPALSEFAAWGRGFEATATAERDRQLAVAAERLGEARSHLAAFDYAAAIHALEAIPEPIRAGEAGDLLAKCVASRDESESLLKSIAARIQSRELEGLLPVVERAIAVRGDRADLRKLRQQLVERRDNRLAQAKAAFEAGDARAAQASLVGVSRDDIDQQMRQFADRVHSAAELEARLAAVVKEAKADGKISVGEARAILTAANACLEANPAQHKVRALIDQCLAILNPATLTNSIGIEMKLIPAGSFSMGDASGASDENPHPVTLTRPFYIGVHEVTSAQWERVMGGVPSTWKGADHPVVNVNWGDAMEFCRRLSALPEEKAAGRVYRLPTEAEWEYACRAGTWTRFSFGDDERLLGEYGWFERNSGGATHPVGKKKPNAWGLYDMHGNVWEWCSDWFGPDGAATDPQGPSVGSNRVRRGGSWLKSALHCRSAYRFGVSPGTRSSDLGFRLAVSLPGAEPPEAGH